MEQQTEQKKESRYILQHDRPNCIGCAACEAVAPDFWEMHDDGKSDIKQGKNLENGWQELDIEEKNLEINKEAADCCPVNVIHLVNKKTKERLI
jgi:ferredoxin